MCYGEVCVKCVLGHTINPRTKFSGGPVCIPAPYSLSPQFKFCVFIRDAIVNIRKSLANDPRLRDKADGIVNEQKTAARKAEGIENLAKHLDCMYMIELCTAHAEHSIAEHSVGRSEHFLRGQALPGGSPLMRMS